MNTQTIPTSKISFTLNATKVHDQLDTLRAALNAMARERGLDTAFDAGVLADTLRDTPLGQRYLALIRRADLLAHLPDRRTVINAALVGAGIYLIARRTGMDKRALRTLSRAGNAIRRTGSRVRARARFTRKTQIPPQFAVSPAATTAYDLACNGEVVQVHVPKLSGDEIKERHGRLLTLGDEYFAVLVGEQPYVFLPDQIGDVQLSINADGRHSAVITLVETPFFDSEIVC